MVSRRYVRVWPEYKFYRKALFIKIFGGVVFGLLYVFYYGGGDTTNYYDSAAAYVNLAFKDFDKFVEAYFYHHTDQEIGDYFNSDTGVPIYRFSDVSATFTTRFYVPLVFVSCYSFVGTSILAAVLSFTGLWKLYRVFVHVFPDIKDKLFISVFCIPSVFFWGSGVMKDSIVISAIGWYVYGFYLFFIMKKRKARYIFYLLVASYLMISIKPYVLFALLPGSIIWLSNDYALRFSNSTMRKIFTPVIVSIGFLLAIFALRQLDDVLGLYKLETVAERASIVNKDLKMDYYGGKSFDIGDYDPSLAGMLSVAHKAVFAALFRPTLLDTQNVVMVLSGLENLYLLIFTVVLLWRLKLFGLFVLVSKNPLLLFSFMFAVFFAFSVGVSISNFGSLVRLRIPALPFFVSALFILRYLYDKGKIGMPRMRIN